MHYYVFNHKDKPLSSLWQADTHFPQSQTTTFVPVCVFLSVWMKVWPLAFQQKAQRFTRKHGWRDGRGVWWIELCWEKCPGKKEEEWGHYLYPHLWPPVHTQRDTHPDFINSSSSSASILHKPPFLSVRLCCAPTRPLSLTVVGRMVLKLPPS